MSLISKKEFVSRDTFTAQDYNNGAKTICKILKKFDDDVPSIGDKIYKFYDLNFNEIYPTNFKIIDYYKNKILFIYGGFIKFIYECDDFVIAENICTYAPFKIDCFRYTKNGNAIILNIENPSDIKTILKLYKTQKIIFNHDGKKFLNKTSDFFELYDAFSGSFLWKIERNENDRADFSNKNIIITRITLKTVTYETYNIEKFYEKENFEKTIQQFLLDFLGKDVIGEIKKYLL